MSPRFEASEQDTSASLQFTVYKTFTIHSKKHSTLHYTLKTQHTTPLQCRTLHTRTPTSPRQLSLTQQRLQQIPSPVCLIHIPSISLTNKTGLETAPHKPSLKEKIQRKLAGSVDPTKKPADPYKSWEARSGQQDNHLNPNAEANAFLVALL